MSSKSTIVSLSMDRDLLDRFDEWVREKGFASRSAGVQRLIGQELAAAADGAGDGPAVATVTFVYDHHARELQERLTHLQHQHLDLVVASTHVHLDHDRCLEVLVLRGPAHAVRGLAERTLATRGVERGTMVVTPAAPQRLPGDHAARGPGWHSTAHEHDHGHDHDHGPQAAPKQRAQKKVAVSRRRGR